VFAAALKHVSKEIGRMQKLDAPGAHVAAARRALAMRRAASFPPRPPTGDRAGEGMRPSPNERRQTRVPPARIGRVSQATKNAQAARDARNREELGEANAGRATPIRGPLAAGRAAEQRDEVSPFQVEYGLPETRCANVLNRGPQRDRIPAWIPCALEALQKSARLHVQVFYERSAYDQSTVGSCFLFKRKAS
jgi:hypothetical protein